MAAGTAKTVVYLFINGGFKLQEAAKVWKRVHSFQSGVVNGDLWGSVAVWWWLMEDLNVFFKLMAKLYSFAKAVKVYCRSSSERATIALSSAYCSSVIQMVVVVRPLALNLLMWQLVPCRDVTRTDSSVPSRCHNSKNVTVLVFLQYCRYRGCNSSGRDIGSIYTYKCCSLPLHAKGTQKMTTAATVSVTAPPRLVEKRKVRVTSGRALRLEHCTT